MKDDNHLEASETALLGGVCLIGLMALGFVFIFFVLPILYFLASLLLLIVT